MPVKAAWKNVRCFCGHGWFILPQSKRLRKGCQAPGTVFFFIFLLDYNMFLFLLGVNAAQCKTQQRYTAHSCSSSSSSTSSSSSRSALHATMSANLRLVATGDATALSSKMFREPTYRCVARACREGHIRLFLRRRVVYSTQPRRGDGRFWTAGLIPSERATEILGDRASHARGERFSGWTHGSPVGRQNTLFFFFLYSSHALYSPFFFSLPPSRNADPRSHRWQALLPPPHYGSCLALLSRQDFNPFFPRGLASNCAYLR